MAAVHRRVKPQWPQGGEHHASPGLQSPEKHLVIAGTGRAGTSFLVRYLTELGLDLTNPLIFSDSDLTQIGQNS